MRCDGVEELYSILFDLAIGQHAHIEGHKKENFLAWHLHTTQWNKDVKKDVKEEDCTQRIRLKIDVW